MELYYCFQFTLALFNVGDAVLYYIIMLQVRGETAGEYSCLPDNISPASITISIIRYCAVLHCTVLYCTVLYCTVP